MQRANEVEILDAAAGVPEELVDRAYCDLARIHRWLGDTACIVRAIRSDPLPVRRVLDVGCANGSVLTHIHRKLGVEVVGIDVNPRRSGSARVPILQADAACDPLPRADVAFSMHVGHHLSEGDLVKVIRNVGRFSRRFILLDLVRHRLPLTLFNIFVTPLVSRITAEDGRKSIRRSYTAVELHRIASTALEGSGATFRHWVAPLYMRQVIDVSYRPASS